MNQTNANTTTTSDQESRQRLLEAQALKISDLQARIKTMQEQVDGLKASILDRWPEGSYQVGRLKVTVKAGAKTINPARFQERFPPEKHPDLYKLAPDSRQARKKLGEDALTGVMTSRKPTVTIS